MDKFKECSNHYIDMYYKCSCCNSYLKNKPRLRKLARSRLKQRLFSEIKNEVYISDV